MFLRQILTRTLGSREAPPAPLPAEVERVIGLLDQDAPTFQLKSGTESLRSSEQFLSSRAVRTDEIARGSNACSSRVLRYIAEITHRGCTSLETGGGWSTCVFAAVSGKHYCVNPDVTANEMIRGFLRDHSVRHGELVFLDAVSDSALPALDRTCVIDVALIDGNHSFPVPIIDWHYIDLHMKKGGLVLIDDTHIQSVRVLYDYLSTEDSYEKVKDIGALGVFRKTADQRVWGWGDQRFNQPLVRHGTGYGKSLRSRFMRYARKLRGTAAR